VGGVSKALKNRAFETGSISPWQKSPAAAPGVVDVETCCGNTTRYGGFNAYLRPNGSPVTMFQNVSLKVGRAYKLSARVALSKVGTVAKLGWWSDATGYTLCKQADSSKAHPTYQTLSCSFTVPSGTTSMKVQLTAENGEWVVTDDWALDW
jgi:hypothetical protein